MVVVVAVAYGVAKFIWMNDSITKYQPQPWPDASPLINTTMPRYHALDSAIVLSTWDPSIKAVDDPDVVHACKNQTKPSAAQMKALRPISSNLHTDGPSVGYLAQDLKEEYFDGQKGVDFLGDCMPFFLIHAGGDLFGQTQPACDTRLDRRNKTCVPIDQPETPSSSFKANNNVVDTPTRELDTDSILSSISSARFSSVQGSSHGEGTKDSKSGKFSRIPLSMLCTDIGSLTDTPGPHPVSQATANLRHIQLLVDLSNKSFMPSLWTGIKQEYVSRSQQNMQEHVFRRIELTL